MENIVIEYIARIEQGRQTVSAGLCQLRSAVHRQRYPLTNPLRISNSTASAISSARPIRRTGTVLRKS